MEERSFGLTVQYIFSTEEKKHVDILNTMSKI